MSLLSLLAKIKVYVASIIVSISYVQVHTNNNTLQDALLKKPQTIFVHGTLFPIISSLVGYIACPRGLHPLLSRPNKYILPALGYTLAKAAPDMFPATNFYLFGWNGLLSFNQRYEAAEKLYQALKNAHYGPITLIGHSHGCNVILNLAAVAKRHNDENFKIERIILLAPPVQTVTQAYSFSSIFKKIYVLYSAGDWIQIADPQGLYQMSCYYHKTEKKTPFFSGRIFDARPHILQARILFGKNDLWHIDFIGRRFVHALPNILHLMDKLNNNHAVKHSCISISGTGKPCALSK